MSDQPKTSDVDFWRAMVRPVMAITGWIALIIVGIVAWYNEVPAPLWLIGLLQAPGSVYLVDRTVRRNKDKFDGS